MFEHTGTVCDGPTLAIILLALQKKFVPQDFGLTDPLPHGGRIQLPIRINSTSTDGGECRLIVENITMNNTNNHIINIRGLIVSLENGRRKVMWQCEIQYNTKDGRGVIAFNTQ